MIRPSRNQIVIYKHEKTTQLYVGLTRLDKQIKHGALSGCVVMQISSLLRWFLSAVPPTFALATMMVAAARCT